MRGSTLGIILFALAILLASCGQSSPVNNPASAVVRDGHARFMVLSPMLIRMEYADDDHFQDGQTLTVVNRNFRPPPYSTWVENGVRAIRTSAMTLRYQEDSGDFTPQNLSVTLAASDGSPVTAAPAWTPDSNPGNLGGWRRSLDNDDAAQTLHDGLLSKNGWFLLDDTQTVLLSAVAPGFVVRPPHSGNYQDGYFFGYGGDYAQGLADLRTLTGPAPMLPRKAFGVWFSRYWAYSDTTLRDLVAQFRANQVPLDTLSIDTDWKLVHNAAGCVAEDAVLGANPGDPCSWNGWSWDSSLFPDPAGFLNWAHAQGLAVTLNIHPSIDGGDPAYPSVLAQTGGLASDSSVPPCSLLQADPLQQCFIFDWTKPQQLKAYFDLHAPMEAQGVDFWWLDWCCDGSSAIAPGLTADTWINSRYAQDNRARGQRWPAFSRIGASLQDGQAGEDDNGAGAFAEHRYTMHFTGDTCATWAMLAFEAQFTAAEGAIGLPYVTHDIGSFLGTPLAGNVCNGTVGHNAHLPDDFYVRWVQFGTFQPLDRLHSNHGDRLPWQYTGAAAQAATDFLRLRERLVPYFYTLSREAYDTGLPIVRSLYLQWPQISDAYNYPTEYTVGANMLVAPVVSAGNPATTTVWIPPGTWTDYFTGEQFTGPTTVQRAVSYEQYPVLLRAGAILPTQPDLPTSSAGPQDDLMLSVWPGADGSFDLYDDEGQGFGYQNGAFSWTHIATSTSPQGCVSLNIGAAEGSFPGALTQRSWTLRMVGVDAPAVVDLQGRPLAGWSYDPSSRTLTANTGPQSTAADLSFVAGPASCATQ